MVIKSRNVLPAWGYKKHMRNWGKISHRKLRYRWENNIKMDFKQGGSGMDGDWIYLIQSRVQSQASAKAVMNIRVPKQTRIFLTGWATIGFSRRICCMVEVDCWLNVLYFLYASVLCTYSITSAGRTAISQVLLHCYHTPHKTPGKSLVPSGVVTNHRVKVHVAGNVSTNTRTSDKLAWCSTVSSCVILQPRCIEMNIRGVIVK